MPIKVNVYNQKGESVGDMKLSDKVFGVKANEVLVHQVMVAQMGNERQVLAHTKGRSEVRGGGRKPWRQKGTGRARAGSIRSPIWRGGGVTFGPKSDKNYSKNINKKMRQKAMFMVLSDKVKGESLVVLDDLKVEEYKTKVFDKILSGLEKKVLKKKDVKKQAVSKEKGKKEVKTKRSVLIINDKKNDKVKRSSSNLRGVKIINLENINILDLLKYRDLIVTSGVIKKIEKVYGNN